MSIYSEVSGLARNISCIRVGVADISHNVRKALVGIGGIARPLYSADAKKPTYFGSAQNLPSVSMLGATANTKDYLLYALGNTSNSVSNTSALSNEVVAYDKNLVLHSCASRPYKSDILAGATTGIYAVFAGGRKSNSEFSEKVVTYNNDLVKTNAVSMTYGLYYQTGFRAGDYACFYGGRDSTHVYNKIYKINNNLSCTSSRISSFYMYDNAATEIGTGAILAGGLGGSTNPSSCLPQSAARHISNQCVFSVIDELKSARKFITAASVPNYALFVGGADSSNVSLSDVDVYDTNFVHTNTSDIAVARYRIAATSLGDFALFGSGRVAPGDDRTTIDCFDNNLVYSQAGDLTTARIQHNAGVVGNNALFIGGYALGMGTVNSVEALKLI